MSWFLKALGYNQGVTDFSGWEYASTPCELCGRETASETRTISDSRRKDVPVSLCSGCSSIRDKDASCQFSQLDSFLDQINFPRHGLHQPVEPKYHENGTHRFSHKFSWLYFLRSLAKMQPGNAKFSHKFSFTAEYMPVFS